MSGKKTRHLKSYVSSIYKVVHNRDTGKYHVRDLDDLDPAYWRSLVEMVKGGYGADEFPASIYRKTGTVTVMG